MDLDQAHFAGFYVSCVNNATGAQYRGRRLLEEGVQACYGGQYNDERGNDACFECPNGKPLRCLQASLCGALLAGASTVSLCAWGAGASTPYPFVGIADRSRCVCLPGYYGIRRGGVLQQCLPCGFGRHRSALRVRAGGLGLT